MAMSTVIMMVGIAAIVVVIAVMVAIRRRARRIVARSARAQIRRLDQGRRRQGDRGEVGAARRIRPRRGGPLGRVSVIALLCGPSDLGVRGGGVAVEFVVGRWGGGAHNLDDQFGHVHFDFQLFLGRVDGISRLKLDRMDLAKRTRHLL